jgi:hypothetical protein
VPHDQQRNDMAFHHERVEKWTAALLKTGNPGDTVAQATERLGDQHPIVRQRNAAVRAYRRAVPWQYVPNAGRGR